MESVAEFLNRLRTILRRDSLDRDLAAQMRLHVELQAEANERAGMAPAEALRAARLQFGSMERFRAECRDERRFGLAEDAAHDVRFASRSLVSEPSFTVAALLALGIGIGAATAIYSLADHVLLRPVPGVGAADELVTVLFEQEPGRGTGISHLNTLDLARATPSLAQVAAYSTAGLQVLLGDGAPVNLEGKAVTGGYFDVLGVRPALGRFFAPEETQPGAEHVRVAVISHRLWQDMFGGVVDVAGRRLRINTHDFTIVGVAPRGFRGTERLGGTDIWLPAASYGVVRHFPAGYMLNRRAGSFQLMVGRLAPGATPELAEAQLRSAMAGLVSEYPEENALYAENVPTVFPGIGTRPIMRERTARTMMVLGGVAALVIFIACANVANLILFRAMRRRGELAVRRAIGADGGRLARQSLVEGLVLATAGSVAGALVAWWLVRALRTMEVRGMPSLAELSLDLRILTFAVLLVLVTGLLFGLAGMWSARGTDMQTPMRSGGAPAGAAVRVGFTMLQVGASIMLLSGGLLLLRSIEALRAVDVGMDPTNVAVFGMMLEPQGYDQDQRLRFMEAVTGLLQQDSRIDHATVASGVPVVAAYMSSGFRLPEDGTDRDVAMQMINVSDDYFATLGMQILAGRPLDRLEAFTAGAGEIPVIVSESAARELFGAEAAGLVGLHAVLGRAIVTARRSPTGTMRVVGVTRDVRRSLREPPEPAMFLPQAANTMPFGAIFVAVRSPLPQKDVENVVHAAVTSLEPALPFWMSGELRERIDATLAAERMMTGFVAGFALLAALLAAIGLYGVVSYGAARRRREMGIRAALGARPWQLATLVSRQAALATAAGAAFGVAGAVVASRLLETWLFGVDRLDAVFYLGGAAGFMLIAMLAAALPAHRAASTDPQQTLRLE